MEKHFLKDNTLLKIIISLVLVLVAVFSCTFIADKMMSADTNKGTIASIDEKKDTVLALTASSTLASTIISAIPDDTATPIANKLADLSGYFLVVLCILYAEKYLLTIIAALVFRFLIPVICLMAIITLFTGFSNIKKFVIKLTVFVLILSLAIPASIGISDLVYSVYESSIDNTIESAEQISAEAEGISKENGSIWTVITDSVNKLKDSASKILSRFIEAVAVMLVTSCIIPLLLLVFFIWIMKKIWGISIPLPKQLTKFQKHGNTPPELPPVKNK